MYRSVSVERIDRVRVRAGEIESFRIRVDPRHHRSRNPPRSPARRALPFDRGERTARGRPDKDSGQRTARSSMSASVRFLNASEAAKRLGVSTKALPGTRLRVAPDRWTMELTGGASNVSVTEL
jgi:hypothetical protein